MIDRFKRSSLEARSDYRKRLTIHEGGTNRRGETRVVRIFFGIFLPLSRNKRNEHASKSIISRLRYMKNRDYAAASS
jgi:hypothetical protein